MTAIAALPARSLGPLRVSAIGLGCMGLSHGYGAGSSDAEAARLLNHALDAGCTLLDTAALYGDGDNERLLGNAVMHRRESFTLASKCVLGVVAGKRTLDGSPARIKASCDESLARLRTDRIDLLYLHRLDRTVQIEESVGAAADLVAQGKVRVIGLSEMSAPTIRRAHAVHPIAAVQSEYSLAVRNPEVAVLDTCRELGIGFVAFSPVGRGMLANAISDDGYAANDIRRHMPRFVGDTLRHNLAIIARFSQLAAAAGCTPAQLALAWLLSRNDTIVPIPGTRTIAHLDENLAACTVQVGTETLAGADALLAPNALRGARYSEAMQKQIDTEFLPGEERVIAHAATHP